MNPLKHKKKPAKHDFVLAGYCVVILLFLCLSEPPNLVDITLNHHRYEKIS